MSADGFDFNKPPDEAREQIGIQLWQALFPRIDDLAEKLRGPYMHVEPGSSLRVDDRYLGRWRGGGLHVSAMIASLDALSTVRMVLASGTLPMTGLYPMLRAAIENAALALYLLGPEKRDERLLRAYGIAAEEAKYQCTFLDSLGEDGRPRAARIQAEIRILVRKRGSLGDSADFRPTADSNTNIVTMADTMLRLDPALSPGVRMPLVAIWQLLSGMSHAKQWALITSLHRTEAIVNDEDGTAYVKMTSGTELVAVVLSRAIEVLEGALRLYGRRARSWSALPEDSADARESH